MKLKDAAHTQHMISRSTKRSTKEGTDRDKTHLLTVQSRKVDRRKERMLFDWIRIQLATPEALCRVSHKQIPEKPTKKRSQRNDDIRTCIVLPMSKILK